MTARTILEALLAVAAIPAATPPASAQDTITAPGEVTCRDCVIVLDTVVTIGGLDGPGLETVDPLSMVAVDRRNRIYIGIYRPPSVSVFDAAGRFVRSFGGAGEGPGEYWSISHINAGPQYIHVFDRNNGRTMLDYDFNVVRVDPFPGQIHNSVVLQSDAVVFSAAVGTRAQAGYRFHMLDTLGTLTSFGVGGPEGFMASADDEGLWFVAMDRNELLRWRVDPEPMLASVFRRAVTEFDRHLHLGPRDWPGVGNSAIHRGAEGLWIVWSAPDPEAPERGRGASIPLGSRDEFVDGWIDLVDPGTGLTVARYHGDSGLKGFAFGSRYVVAYQETEAGVPYIHLLEPKLVRGSGGS